MRFLPTFTVKIRNIESLIEEERHVYLKTQRKRNGDQEIWKFWEQIDTAINTNLFSLRWLYVLIVTEVNKGKREEKRVPQKTSSVTST